jgi:uncharacterized membrane protein YhaH (DUF805 family)
MPQLKKIDPRCMVAQNVDLLCVPASAGKLAITFVVRIIVLSVLNVTKYFAMIIFKNVNVILPNLGVGLILSNAEFVGKMSAENVQPFVNPVTHPFVINVPKLAIFVRRLIARAMPKWRLVTNVIMKFVENVRIKVKDFTVIIVIILLVLNALSHAKSVIPRCV